MDYRNIYGQLKPLLHYIIMHVQKKCRPVVGDQPFLHGMLSKSIRASPSGSKVAVYHILQDSLYVIAIFITPEITKKADVIIFDGPGIRAPRRRLLRKQINGVFSSATNAMSSQMYIIYLGSVPRVFKYETGVRDSNQKSVHSFEKLKKGHMFKFNSPRAWEMMKVMRKARRFRVHWDHDPRQMVYHLEHHLLKFTFKGSTVRISDWDYSCQYGGISIYTTKKLTNNVNYGNAVKGDHFCENRGEYFPRQFSYTDQIAIHIVALFIPGYSEGEIEMELYLAQSESHHLKCGELHNNRQLWNRRTILIHSFPKLQFTLQFYYTWRIFDWISICGGFLWHKQWHAIKRIIRKNWLE